MFGWKTDEIFPSDFLAFVFDFGKLVAFPTRPNRNGRVFANCVNVFAAWKNPSPLIESLRGVLCVFSCCKFDYKILQR